MKATTRENNKLKSQLSTRPNSLCMVEQQLKSIDHEIINLQNKLNDNPSLNLHIAYQLRLQHMKQLRADLYKKRYPGKVSIKHTYKKPNDAVAYTSIVNYVQQVKRNGDITLTLENTANSTNIHPNIIKKIFLRLNREGI